jgi:chromate transporter
MAVIALMERECIRRHGCLEAKEFLDGAALGKILGPFAVNVAIFIGSRMFGPIGALLAAISFLIPSEVLVVILSWLYAAFHHIQSLQSALAGLGPVVIALILSAAWSMGRKELHSVVALMIAATTCIAGVLHINPVWTLLAAGLLGLGLKLGESPPHTPTSPKSQRSILPLLPGMAARQEISSPAPRPIPVSGPISGGTAAMLSGSVGLVQLGWIFLKVGLVFFGGGFVLIPVLNHQLVQELGWLTPQQFMDGVAISELTHGPIAVLATFAGFLKAGVPGALVATAALFAPATILMLLISSFYDRLRNKRFAQDFLAGVEPAVIGLIVAAAVALGPSSISLARPVSVELGLLSLVLLVRFRWHPAFVLLIGAIAGIVGPGLFH